MLNPKGVTIKISGFPVSVTVRRIIELLKKRDAKIYVNIDQQKELSTVGKTIPPMHLVIFGNPNAGSLILGDTPVVGLDLPLKILVWENEKQVVYVAYNSPGYLGARYCLIKEVNKLLDLDGFVSSVLDETK